jgi:hypothetical protein
MKVPMYVILALVLRSQCPVVEDDDIFLLILLFLK